MMLMLIIIHTRGCSKSTRILGSCFASTMTDLHHLSKESPPSRMYEKHRMYLTMNGCKKCCARRAKRGAKADDMPVKEPEGSYVVQGRYRIMLIARRMGRTSDKKEDFRPLSLDRT